MNYKFSTLLLLVGSFVFGQTGGGMWIPTELNEKEMKTMGMNISAQDIFNPHKASIKDAIAHFGGGCTSEVISPQGLLLTNHHCGYSQIQSHSTIENDYLQDGFWSKSLAEELPNPGLTASFIVDIKDVTNQILPSNGEQPSDAEINSKIEMIVANANKESWQEAFVKPFYLGNKYYLFITETYKDVRLVGAPPSSIGKFGSDTDNWVWPRHTGDFSIFRIYADKNNRPAEYSKDNIPYKPKHYLPINIKGLENDDFTFVFGFPGTTNEYLPSIAIDQIVNTVNPAKIEIRDAALKIMDGYMKQDQNIKIKYASKYASIANYWKNWIGVNQGINKSGAVKIKENYEDRLLEKIQAQCKKEKSKRCVEYPQLLSDFEKLYTEIEKYNLAKGYFDEAIYRNSETFRIALLLNNLLKSNGDPAYKKRIAPYLASLYKNYEAKVDKEVSLATWNLYEENVPEEFKPDLISITEEDLNNSFITGGKEINGVKFNEHPEDALKATDILDHIAKDPLIQKIGMVEMAYTQNVSPKRVALQNKIDAKMKSFMKAQMDFMKDEKVFFPDANSTLRVTYGKVDGYAPRDAVYYENTTYLKGVMEKYVPGDYEFDVPEKLRTLYAEKDFGQYAEDGKMPVNFIATNHTTGGNSGSPALDADGNLVGLNFDRVWEGTMSDLYYDPSISRNIMVDARYILFIIDKYAGAERLIKEMELVK